VEKVVGAAVELGDRDDVVARAGNVEDGVGDGGLARGMGERAATAFKRATRCSKTSVVGFINRV